MSFAVEYYKKTDGTYPAEDFIIAQDKKMRAKIFRNLELLEKTGSDLREPYSSHLDDGIFELRTQLGSNISRVLYFFVVGERIILTHGFTKKSRKTPPGEIVLAKKFRANYFAMKEG